MKLADNTVCENCENILSENVLLKLKEELKCKNVYVDSLQNRLFTYDNFITGEKLFKNEKFCLSIWILEKIMKISNNINLQRIRKKENQIFCLHVLFCHGH